MRFAAGPFVGRRLFATGVPLGDRYKLRHSPVGLNVAESVGLGDFGRVDEYSKRVTVRKLERK